jgi:phage FluMu gp28-like protein
VPSHRASRIAVVARLGPDRPFLAVLGSGENGGSGTGHLEDRRVSAIWTKEQWAEMRRQATPVVDTVLDGLVIGQREAALLPKALLPYQATTLGLLEQVSTRVLFVEKSRRVGLTWGLASYAVLRAARNAQAGGMDVYYISYAQAMTRDFITDCGDWARAFNHGSMEIEEYFWDDSDDAGERHIQAFRIKFGSGFEINGLSSAPRSLRGKQGVVIIDEAAFVDDLKELLKAALALLMWGGQVIVCSTHNGAENEFNLAIQDILGGRKPYAHLHIDFDEALMQGLYERICLRNGVTWTPEGEAQWRDEIIQFYGDGADEELYCVPSMGSGSWLTAPLIEARMTSDAPVLSLELPPDYLQRAEHDRDALMADFWTQLDEALETIDLEQLFAFGFDFARVADLSVGTLLQTTKNLLRESALTVELRGVPGDEQKAIVRKILRHVRGRLVGAAFDATGMGWTVAEDMGREFGLRAAENEGGLVWAIKFTEDWYRVNMPPLKVAFEDDVIAIHKDGNHLADLRAVKVVRGIPRVPTLREGTGNKKRHGDYAIALVLAYFASRMRWAEYAYEAIKPRPGRFDEPAPGTIRDTGNSPFSPSTSGFRMSSMRGNKGIW